MSASDEARLAAAYMSAHGIELGDVEDRIRKAIEEARRDAAAETLEWAAGMFGDPVRLLRNLAAEIRSGERAVPMGELLP